MEAYRLKAKFVVPIELVESAQFFFLCFEFILDLFVMQCEISVYPRASIAYRWSINNSEQTFNLWWKKQENKNKNAAFQYSFYKYYNSRKEGKDVQMKPINLFKYNCNF